VDGIARRCFANEEDFSSQFGCRRFLVTVTTRWRSSIFSVVFYMLLALTLAKYNVRTSPSLAPSLLVPTTAAVSITTMEPLPILPVIPPPKLSPVTSSTILAIHLQIQSRRLQIIGDFVHRSRTPVKIRISDRFDVVPWCFWRHLQSLLELSSLPVFGIPYIQSKRPFLWMKPVNAVNSTFVVLSQRRRHNLSTTIGSIRKTTLRRKVINELSVSKSNY
jgi:hypothetical protein